MKNKIITTTIALVVLVAAIITIMQIQQAQAKFKSSKGDIGQGQEDGVAAGAAAFNSGIPLDQAACPAGHSTSYCIGYGSGFVRGWNDVKDLAP